METEPRRGEDEMSAEEETDDEEGEKENEKRRDRRGGKFLKERNER